MSEELQNIPEIKPGQEDALYRRSGSSRTPKQSNFNGLLVFIILLMAIIMAIGGYTLYEVQQKLDQADILLTKGQESISDLNERLAATGTDVSKTLQNMQGEIGENFKQIDMLWGHAYRTNKPNIEKNRKAVSSIRKQLDDDLGMLKRSAVSVEASFKSVSDEMTRANQELREDTQGMTTQISLVRGQVQDQETNLLQNEKDIQRINNQLVEIEEAIDAIDNHRRQINQRIVEMQNLIQSQ
ncbi:MAG: hypothetical protein ACJ0Q6_03215 [Candidatus Azotimanducaceae bacterium]|uniref:Uncharacterized protein n=1 Tax=OM182 bacterium TaxID=2510334 RepID=A0A520S4R6_9GAMM|nr:MAG: hypothetical protein EVA68_01130 [OM182 bacterium]